MTDSSILLNFEKIDAIRRPGKTERFNWLILHEASRPAMFGRMETFQLLQEAREVFLDGYYVATLLVAMSYIEHTVIEELQLLGHLKGSTTFSNAIEIAETKKVFPIDWLTRAKKLISRRNSFAHLKSSQHEHSLGIRVLNEQLTKGEMLEVDAKDAIDLMNNFFVATLREMKL